MIMPEESNEYSAQNSEDQEYMYVDAPDAPAYFEEFVIGDEGTYDANLDYGGMDEETYHGIIIYKNTNTMPDFIMTNEDRNARSHWKMKCQKYEVYMGNLIYVSKEIDGVDPRKRYVIRVGEVLPILRAVHNKIGHLGMKRTQAAVLQCFYWRSVRADVQRFVANCSFCNQKKEAGKKVLRAPINVFGDDVLEVIVIRELKYGASRFAISLNGVDENISLSQRMPLSSYTFPNRPKINHSAVGRSVTRNKPKLSQIPLGHTLDGLHEIHSTPPVSGKDLFPLHWFQDEEVCRRSRGRRKNCDRNMDQIRRAAEALKQMSTGKLENNDEFAGDELIFSMNEFNDQINPTLPLFNGLATRYMAENHLKITLNEQENYSANIYEFNIEHWHLPPTYS